MVQVLWQLVSWLTFENLMDCDALNQFVVFLNRILAQKLVFECCEIRKEKIQNNTHQDPSCLME
jgi:hypothetical protein